MEVSPSTEGCQLLAIRDYFVALLGLCPTGGDRFLPALDVHEAHAACGEFYTRGRISINATENFSSRNATHSHTAFGSNSGWKHNVGTWDLVFLMASRRVAPRTTLTGWPSTFRPMSSLTATDATAETAGAAVCMAFWASCLVTCTALFIVFLRWVCERESSMYGSFDGDGSEGLVCVE
jgi:hypothetical protein